MSDYPCCSEHNCRRKMPVLVRRGGFSGQWVAITRYKRHGDDDRRPGLIEAQEKHVIDPHSQVEIELGSSVLRDLHEWVKTQYARTEDGSDVEGAYRAVLDKLAELAEAKETELIGPRPEAAQATS